MLYRFIFLMCILTVVPSAAQTNEPAQSASETVDPIEADRPDQTETPSIVPKGRFQVETGFAYEKLSSSENALVTPSILWKYGINENFELRLITEYRTEEITDQKINGLLPVVVGFKVKLLDEAGVVPKTSFIGHIAVPKLGSKSFQTTYYAPEFRFLMQHTLSENFSFSYNLGAEWDGETPEPAFLYTTAFGYAITNKFGCFVEVYGFAPQLQKANHNFDAGFTYLISNDFMLDVAAGFGLTENAPQSFVSAGFSFRI